MIDPVTLAVLKGRLEQIADEMDARCFGALSTRSSPRPMMPHMGFMMQKPVTHWFKGNLACRFSSGRCLLLSKR